MYLGSPTLSQISLKIKILSEKWFFKFWSRDYFRETKIRFLAAILKRNVFLMFFLLIYGCFRRTQIWCKFRTEIPTGKYLKWLGPSGPPYAQTGVKSSLGT